MIVKAISNNQKRDITLNKLYPVFIKNKDKIYIIDDFGSLSVYDVQDFIIYKESSKSYRKTNQTVIYQTVDYPSFLEDYYNDDKKAIANLENSQVSIFKQEVEIDELIEMIFSEYYSWYEKSRLIIAMDSRLTAQSAKSVANYLMKNEVESEIKAAICQSLSKYHLQEVYELFLKYIRNEVEEQAVQEIVIDYFNHYQ